MTRLTDGTKTIAISMHVWNGSGLTPDWSNDFFGVGGLKYNEDEDAYEVQDVDYCIEQAYDWKYSWGDFADDEPNENNFVYMREV